MKKESVTYSIIISIFIFLLLAGCGRQAADSGSGEKDSSYSKGDLAQFDDDVQELLTRNDDYVEPEPTSFDNIQAALDEGSITKEQWAMLTLLAAFDKDNLPDNYRGEDPEVFGDGILMEVEWWLAENWDSLDQQTKDALEPFYLLPDDPGSFFNPDNEAKKGSMLKSLELVPSVQAAGWDTVDFVISTSPKKIAIIYYPQGNSAMKQRALWINESLTKAWPMYENLLSKYPDQEVFIYVTDTGVFYGTAIMRYIANADRCYVKVTKKEDEKVTKATAAHELFHCFQYALPLKYDKIPRMWLMEATATWSEHWVYPEYNTEWRFLGGFFGLLHEDMVQWDRWREYTRYTWYYYLMQSTGDLGKIKKDLVDVKTKDGRLVVKDTPNFGDLFADYARWNWNQDPEFRYSDTPSFPTGSYKGKKMNPNGASYKEKLIQTKAELSQSVDVDPFAMAYRSYAFTDNIDKVVFKFDKEGDDLHQRQALIKIGEVWHWEDWTELKERKFCRTRPEEKVIAVVLILSNADHDQSNFFKEFYTIDTQGKCNPEWRGSTSWSWGHGWGWQILNAQHSLQNTGMMVSYDTLVYDEEEDAFLVKDMVISYRYIDNHRVSFAMDDCGMIYDDDLNQYSGSAQSSWDIPEDHPSMGDAPTRMYVDDDDPMLYHVNIDVLPDRDDWISYLGHRSSARKACALEGIFTPSEGSYYESRPYYDRVSDFPQKPYDIEVQISEDGRRLKGTKFQDFGSGDEKWQIRIDVDYAYG